MKNIKGVSAMKTLLMIVCLISPVAVSADPGRFAASLEYYSLGGSDIDYKSDSRALAAARNPLVYKSASVSHSFDAGVGARVTMLQDAKMFRGEWGVSLGYIKGPQAHQSISFTPADFTIYTQGEQRIDSETNYTRLMIEWRAFLNDDVKFLVAVGAAGGSLKQNVMKNYGLASTTGDFENSRRKDDWMGASFDVGLSKSIGKWELGARYSHMPASSVDGDTPSISWDPFSIFVGRTF